MQIISSFTPPEHQFLSSFYRQAPLFDKDGVCFKTLHQAFFAAMSDDASVKKYIASLNIPEEIVKFGNTLVQSHHTEMWQIETMFFLSMRKFTEYPILKRKLIETNPAPLQNGLVYPDLFWGVHKGEGMNWIGKINMQIRDTLITA